ncbi:MAG: sugar phosphate isomerase/epimerase [Clostridia bacterium]|nr:sugar phosphate isomerase/epimerase [Clostridia bacterium]
MKLSSSTGDFSFYVNSVHEKVACFRDTKFRYINLEQTSNISELLDGGEDDWKHFADACGNAAAEAGVEFVLSHAPCLHNAVLPAMENRDDETYRYNVRAIRRSLEVCHVLGIPRIVIHACTHKSFTEEMFYAYNRMFYSEFMDLAEAYGIVIMTENWDNDASHFSTGKQMRDFIDAVGHPLFAACWDTAHGNIAASSRELGQYRNILALGDKLKGLHISDNFGDSHHHSWPFAGIINFDQVMQALIDVDYDGYFNFEASYTLLHQKNPPYHRQPWEYRGEAVTGLLNPPIYLKQKAVDLLYDIGEYLLTSYHCFEA